MYIDSKSQVQKNNNIAISFSKEKHKIIEIRAPVFHLPVIRHTFAEHSTRFCLINLLNKDTRSTIIIERVETDPYPSFKFYMNEQIFDSYQKEDIIINCPVCRRHKINDL